MRISLLETDKYSFIHSYFLSFIQFLMPSFDHLLSTFSFFPQLNTFITLKPMLYETEVHSPSQLSKRAVICQKQISVEGDGHCFHRPSSNGQTGKPVTVALDFLLVKVFRYYARERGGYAASQTAVK